MAEEVDFGGVGDPLNPSEAAVRLSDFSSPEQQRPASGNGDVGTYAAGASSLGGSELPFAFAQPPAPPVQPSSHPAAHQPVQLAPAAVTVTPAPAPSQAAVAAASMGASVSSAAGSLFERIRAAQAQAQTGGSPSKAAPLMTGGEGEVGQAEGGGQNGSASAGGAGGALGASSQFFSAMSGRSSSLMSGSATGGDDDIAPPDAATNDPSAGYDTGTFYASRSELEPSSSSQQQPAEAAGATPTVPGSGGLRVPSYAPVASTETAHAPYSTGETASDKAKMALSSAWGVASKFGSQAARAGGVAAGRVMEKARGEEGAGGNASLLREGGAGAGGAGGGAEMMESGTVNGADLGGSGTAFGAQFAGAGASSTGMAAMGAPEGTSATPMAGIGSHGGYGQVSSQEGGQQEGEYDMWTYFRTFVGDLRGLVERAPLWAQSVLFLLVIWFLWSVLK